MVEQAGADSESLFGVSQGRIHGDQGVVEAAQRIIAQTGARQGVLRRISSCREPAKSQDVEAPQTLPKVRLCSLRFPLLHGSQQSFGGRGVREREMLEDL